jgi:hypothetical protein
LASYFREVWLDTAGCWWLTSRVRIRSSFASMITVDIRDHATAAAGASTAPKAIGEAINALGRARNVVTEAMRNSR